MLRVWQRKRSDGAQAIAGTSILEFAIALPVFVLFLYSFIEFARYLAIRSVMIKAAQDALQHAVKVQDFDYNIAPTSLVRDCSNPDYCAFAAARTSVIRKAEVLAITTLLAPYDQPSSATLKFYTLDDGTKVNALVLRPTDQYTDFAGNPAIHPTRPQTPADQGNTSQTNIKLLLRSNPIVVEMQADMTPLLPSPFLGTVPIHVVAAGYREVGPAGAFPQFENP